MQFLRKAKFSRPLREIGIDTGTKHSGTVIFKLTKNPNLSTPCVNLKKKVLIRTPPLSPVHGLLSGEPLVAFWPRDCKPFHHTQEQPHLLAGSIYSNIYDHHDGDDGDSDDDYHCSQ